LAETTPLTIRGNLEFVYGLEAAQLSAQAAQATLFRIDRSLDSQVLTLFQDLPPLKKDVQVRTLHIALAQNRPSDPV